MGRDFLLPGALPFCGGCGHHLIVNSTVKALDRMTKLEPSDVILVTDIGCHGVIDRFFRTHTVHGLHGRSVALAAGISVGLDNPNKKVLVYIGDGGATIGLQHLIEAAHRNFNMTVVLHNNMLYGMTGGQPSGLTPCGYKTRIFPEGQPYMGFDLCRKANDVGAAYARRVLGTGDFSEHLEEAMATDGFSLVEVMEICPSYGAKRNPGIALAQIVEEAGLKVQLYTHPPRESYKLPRHKLVSTLFDDSSTIDQTGAPTLTKRRSLVLSGSAGEGIQSAAEIFARAAVASGLHVTLKGSYPVTVGVGFSTSKLIVSPEPIVFTGITIPDVMVITSEDGLKHSRQLIDQMNKGILFIDASLDPPETSAQIIQRDFRNHTTARSAALFALFCYLGTEAIFPPSFLVDALNQSKFGKKIDAEQMVEAAGSAL